jgi:hypothetical protein
MEQTMRLFLIALAVLALSSVSQAHPKHDCHRHADGVHHCQ